MEDTEHVGWGLGVMVHPRHSVHEVGSDNSLRIVLVGKTGSGKSATANTILGQKLFASRIAPHAVTQTCQKESRKWKERDLMVVDTPGLFDTKVKLETTCTEISRCVLYSCPGPHAIILVLRLGRHTEEEQETVIRIKAIFGEAAMKYMIVLFTRKDELEDQLLNDFIADSDANLKSIIRECEGRCLAINNKAEEAEREAQVQELVQLVEFLNCRARLKEHSTAIEFCLLLGRKNVPRLLCSE
uniref:GTPase, IMAP family member 7 n=1 Tax=Peromyscus maniculatus bairdii TaxID=230844 RepID=A0A8C8W5G6_PERMB